MRKVQSRELRLTANMLSLGFDDERIELLVSPLSQALESLKPLEEETLSKELEPTTYLYILTQKEMQDD